MNRLATVHMKLPQILRTTFGKKAHLESIFMDARNVRNNEAKFCRTRLKKTRYQGAKPPLVGYLIVSFSLTTSYETYF